MNTPLVTIGIPFYNNQETLLSSIKSIFAQTYKNWELILVDDGSTDSSLHIARFIDDSRVRVISDGINKKLAARLNQIIGLAKGKYVARMDADDLCLPTRIERQVQLLEKDSKVDIVGCGAVYLNKENEPLGQTMAPEIHEKICAYPYRTFGICHPSIVARKSWYKKYYYDETVTLGQDFNLWLRSYQSSVFANIPDPLYCYRLEASFMLVKQIKNRYTSAGYIFKHYQKRSCLYEALYYAMMQYLRMAAEIGFCSIGLKGKLLARRYKPLNNAEIEKYNSKIHDIENTNLPIIAT
ncbi:MAG: glycosyltransferase [Sedimentisphaerales bacterium]|nr:glycosyltransferase [Sedimentisphaerales bacterium]